MSIITQLETLNFLDRLHREYETAARDGVFLHPTPDPSMRLDKAGLVWISNYIELRQHNSTHEAATRGILADIRTIEGRLAPEDPPEPVPGPGGEHGRLRAQGLEIVTEDGHPWFGIGVTGFTFLQAWLDQGESGVSAFCDWMRRGGVQFVRAAGCYNAGSGGGIGRFIPSEYGMDRYLSGLRTLGDYLRRRGLRCKLSVFCDMQTPELAGVNQVEFFGAVSGALSDYADVFFVDAGNEVEKNGVQWETLPQPSVFASRGSPLTDGTPPWSSGASPWNYFDCHDARNDAWPKAAKSVFEIQGSNTSPPQPPAGLFAIPGGSDEMIGIGPNAEPGRTTNNPDDVFDYVAAPFGCYRVLHVRAFISRLDPAQIDPVTQACVDAGVAAARAVPAEWRRGQYTRGGLQGFPLVDSPLDPPVNGEPRWWLRAYGRLQGDRALVTIQRPRPDQGLRVEAIDGWRIVERRGSRENVILVTR